MEVEELKAQARGRWHGILTMLGVEAEYLTGKHGPCPVCKGTDRFRWDNKDGEGSWFCNQCQPQAGDGLKLLQKVFGLSFKEAMEKVLNVIGGIDKMPVNKEPDIEEKKKNLNKLWTTSESLTGNDPVSRYLHNRGINLTPNNIRYCAKCYNKELGKEIPAMIAKIQGKDGKPVSLHRTYLNIEKNQKADLVKAKRLMPGVDLLKEASVRLSTTNIKSFKPGIIGVAEGIETAMAASQMFQVPVWSCISSTLLEGWSPPKGYYKVLICGDNDNNFVGQRAAYVLAHKLYQKKLMVVVKIPTGNGMDWNDELITRINSKNTGNK